MPDNIPADCPTIDGGLAVSATLLQQVASDQKDAAADISKIEAHMMTLTESSSQTATASMRMADIAEARSKRDIEDRDASRAAKQAKEEREAKTQEKALAWVGDNYRYILLICILVFYPQLINQIQSLGLLPAVQPAPVTVVQPAPMPALDVSEP